MTGATNPFSEAVITLTLEGLYISMAVLSAFREEFRIGVFCRERATALMMKSLTVTVDPCSALTVFRNSSRSVTST